MADNSNSYTFREYKRNKKIFWIIHLIIGITYLWLLYLFLVMLQKTNYSLIGLVISSVIFIFAIKFVQKMDRQNRQDVRRNYNTWGKGAGAELIEEKILELLPQEYLIVKDFNTGHGNIDFIVIGPNGIFAIEVKSENGLVSFVNEKLLVKNAIPVKNYLQQTFAEKMWLSDYVYKHLGKRYDVTGLLEFPNGKIDKQTIHGKINDIWIGGRGFHKYVINKSSIKLNSEEIEAIHKFLTTSKATESIVSQT
ncbi:NERD domain-containing protein [Candidatus Beckwithbacteria bacterium]|nr:NERD domain-containing protein [Candidatus Beckwithbacteria bacterium]